MVIRPLPREEPRASAPVAVIDIGSNSGRLVVLDVGPDGNLEVLESAGSPLRLVHELGAQNRLSEIAVERTVHVLRGFQSLARGSGAQEVVTVATAAVREATNGADVVQRLEEETGLSITIIDGAEEARFGFLGAVHSLPLDHGIVLEVGGGSIQLVHFRDRRLARSWSLPLGSLRLSDRFLRSDPPSSSEMQALREHVRRTVSDAGALHLERDECLVGTGGTIRNLAKMHRRDRVYPIPRLHGYVLDRPALDAVLSQLIGRTAAERAKVPGLNPNRFDSIVGGALCVQTVMEALKAPELTAAGSGMREGVVLDRLVAQLPSSTAVRDASVRALVERFRSWQPWRAHQRRQLATMLGDRLDPRAPGELKEALERAASLIDIGRSIDFYGHQDHTASIVLLSDLAGFSHRLIALVASLLRLTSKSHASLKAYAPLVRPGDIPALTRSAAILALADDAMRQAPLDNGDAPVRCEWRDGRVVLAASWLDPWPLQGSLRHLHQVFAVDVDVTA